MVEQVPIINHKGRLLDRWDLTPVKRGHLRGQPKNIRWSEEVSRYGIIQVVDFDLWIEKDVEVPVRMAGTDFMGRIHNNLLLDIPDADPNVRPVRPTRVTDSRKPENEIVAHFPGRTYLMRREGAFSATLIVGLPLVSVLFLTIILGLYFNWFR